MIRSRLQFIREQGFPETAASDGLYEALMFQPRAVGALVLAGVLIQHAWVFVVLAAALWWSALAPAHNPFDVVWNIVVARPLGRTQLGHAPAPRRFAAGVAGTVALTIALALGVGVAPAAWILEAFFVVAVLAVVVARSCAGAALYHRLFGGLSAPALQAAVAARDWHGAGSGGKTTSKR
jgi:hypothetical protein